MGSVFSGLFSAATSALSGIYGYLAVAGVCLLLGAGGTWRVMSWHEQAQKVQIVTKTIKQIQYQDRVTTQVVTKYIAVKAADTEATKTLIQEVPVYVTPKADAACVVPLGLVRVWDSAVHGAVPDPATGIDDAASGLACSDLAKAFVEAAGQYDATAHQLVALQDWVKQQAAPQ